MAYPVRRSESPLDSAEVVPMRTWPLTSYQKRNVRVARKEAELEREGYIAAFCGVVLALVATVAYERFNNGSAK